MIVFKKGHKIIIDQEDFYLFNKYTWAVVNNGCDNFYLRTCIPNKKTLYFHRKILKINKKQVHVDHINGNSLDNRKSNLRICTNHENRWNSKLSKKNSTGFKGVRTRSGLNCFQAYITFKRKFYYLGYYKTAEEAAKVYDKKAKELFGEFARLNFPEDKNK